MKNEKAKQFSKLARHIRKRAIRAGGEALEMVEDTISAIASLRNLSASLIGIDTPEMVLDRTRDTFGKVNMLENSPECYGRSLRQTRQKYMGEIHASHNGRNDADCELDEISAVVVGAVGNVNMGESSEATE